MKYSPERFSSSYENLRGPELWAFLTSVESVLRMETATYLSRPAAEPLSPYLVKNFGESVKADRTKQMIGHMIRQIMESRGYQVDRGNVRITTPDNMFTSATRYKES